MTLDSIYKEIADSFFVFDATIIHLKMLSSESKNFCVSSTNVRGSQILSLVSLFLQTEITSM